MLSWGIFLRKGVVSRDMFRWGVLSQVLRVGSGSGSIEVVYGELGMSSWDRLSWGMLIRGLLSWSMLR